MHSQPDKTNWNTASGLLAIVLWSTTFAVARSLSERIGAIATAAAVYLIGGALCLLLLRWKKRPVRGLLSLPRHYLLGCGTLFVLYTVLIYVAVGLARGREQLLEVALLNYLWPSLTILFSLPILKKRAKALLVPGTILALAGVFLVMTQGANISWAAFREHAESNPAAYILATGAAVCWALYSNLARRWAPADGSGAVELFIAATGLVLVPIAVCFPAPMVWDTRTLGEALLLGSITALSYALWDVAIRMGNLLLVVACSYFTPLLSTVVSCAYLHVSPSSRLWLGCLLLIAGSLLTWRSVAEPVATQQPLQNS